VSDLTFMNRSGRAGAILRPWIARHERYLWAALAVVVVSVQWPALKGFYYRAADVPPPPTLIQWHSDLSSALLEAQRTEKSVLVDFSAEWCPPCIVMKHDVWPDDAVERTVSQSYVPLLIDVDRDRTVADRYGIHGIPTILVLDAKGQVIRRGGFLSAPGMVRFLTRTD
jgi:thiol:disulfide interchange protein